MEMKRKRTRIVCPPVAVAAGPFHQPGEGRLAGLESFTFTFTVRNFVVHAAYASFPPSVIIVICSRTVSFKVCIGPNENTETWRNTKRKPV